MKSSSTYKIVLVDTEERFEATGPLIVEHSEVGFQENKAGWNTLDASINRYFLKTLKVIHNEGRLVDEYSNYMVYELKSSGPCLSVQQSTFHGKFPRLSQAASYISMFDEYNQEIVKWMPENKLSWDEENRVLTIL
jgi:hypothetical protein